MAHGVKVRKQMFTDPAQALRRQLARRMAALDLSANALAKRAGAHGNAAKDILNGNTTNPRLDTVVKLARALGCTVGDLLEETVDDADRD